MTNYNMEIWAQQYMCNFDILNIKMYLTKTKWMLEESLYLILGGVKMSCKLLKWKNKYLSMLVKTINKIKYIYNMAIIFGGRNRKGEGGKSK